MPNRPCLFLMGLMRGEGEKGSAAYPVLIPASILCATLQQAAGCQDFQPLLMGADACPIALSLFAYS